MHKTFPRPREKNCQERRSALRSRVCRLEPAQYFRVCFLCVCSHKLLLPPAQHYHGHRMHPIIHVQNCLCAMAHVWDLSTLETEFKVRPYLQTKTIITTRTTRKTQIQIQLHLNKQASKPTNYPNKPKGSPYIIALSVSTLKLKSRELNTRGKGLYH